MTDREKKDAVTIGQIRLRREKSLESDLETFCKLVRGRKQHEMLKFVEDVLSGHIVDLINLDGMASTIVIFGE